MSRSVLLVDPDVDALGALASSLRARGLTVTLADEPERAVERARRARPDAILADKALFDDAELTDRLDKERELREIPRFVLVPGDADDELTPDILPRDNVDLITKRMYALPKQPPPVEAEQGDFRGDLQQVSVVDLLQLLGMNRRTGALTITTASGVGEVRLVEGDIVDAVYRRLEGEKALFRLLAEEEGSFAFASGRGTALRRVQTPTHHLLMDGMRQVDEVRARREGLRTGSDALLVVAPPGDDASEEVRRVAEVLAVPRTIDELLDDAPLGDLQILDALDQMLRRGEVRRIARGAVRVLLADPEQMSMLAAVVKRLQPQGFRGDTRVVIAANSKRVGAVAHAARRIADAVPPAESTPAPPVPHLLATLHLGDGVNLDLLGLPMVASFAPLWQLSLAGAAAVLRIGDADVPELDRACSVAEVPVFDAAALLGDVDEADPAQVALLLRSVLEQLAGDQ